jgi:putative MATE family efflux protein
MATLKGSPYTPPMQDLTTGSIPRHLLKTSGFMLVTMTIQTLYILTDLYWVGRLGKEAVAGVGVAGNLMFVVLAVSQMMAVGTTTAISHAAGRRDRDRAILLFKQSLGLSTLVGVLFLAIAMWFRHEYAVALAADAPTAVLADEYLAWFIPSMALQFGIVAMSAALRATGQFKPGMVVQTATVIINLVLSPVLMFGWLGTRPMGVTGAAVGTFVAVLVGTVWLAFYFLPQDAYLKFTRGGWQPDFSSWRTMLGVGLPAGAEFALMAVYLFIVYVVSRPFGAAAQAGVSIGMRIMQSLFMPVVALAMGVAPLAGQNFGARNGARVRETFRTSALIAAAVMGVIALLCHIAPAAMIRFFSPDPEVVAVGDEYLRIVSWNFVASGLVFVTGSMFQAMGNTMPSLITSCIRLVIVAVPAVLLSRLPGFELRWIWYLTVVSVTLQLAIALLLLKREFRLRLNFDARPDMVTPTLSVASERG